MVADKVDPIRKRDRKNVHNRLMLYIRLHKMWRASSLHFRCESRSLDLAYVEAMNASSALRHMEKRRLEYLQSVYSNKGIAFYMAELSHRELGKAVSRGAAMAEFELARRRAERKAAWLLEHEGSRGPRAK